MISEKKLLKQLEFENKEFKQPKIKTESPHPVNGSFYSKLARATVFYPSDLVEENKEDFKQKWELKYLENRKLY
jgi:hypothetical protein